ncbi:MAG: thioredoxin family protein [Loktanella sp.]|nr:thioredoxin family protein [Loktanella sp.]
MNSHVTTSTPIKTARRALFGLAAMAVVGVLFLQGAQREGERPVSPDRITEARLSGMPVLVEFGAGSCVACREMKVVLAELEQTHGDQMVILDIDFGSPEGRQVRRNYGMQAIPTQLFFGADGSDLGRHLGAISAADIVKRLELTDG